jgi:hypothetical protein
MNVVKFLKDQAYTGLEDYSAIREAFYNLGIKVSYENDKEEISKVRRFIFTSNKKARNVDSNDLVLESNGLVLEAPEWRPLVIPPLAPRVCIDTKKANLYISKNMYDIYYIEDGTVINLYYYNDSWAMSTIKGIDVSNNVFNTLTYKEMFNESLECMGIIPQEFYDSLNKNTSYTFGFKHPDLHPFMEGKGTPIYKVWFVQMVEIKQGLEHMDISTHEDYFKINRSSIWEKIPNHRISTLQIKSIGAMFNKLKLSYEQFINKGVVCYGFILVAKNHNDFIDERDYSVLMLESSLLKFIRELYYDESYTGFSKEKHLNRTKTIIINSFLDNNRTELFSRLFPQFMEKLNSIMKLELKITDQIYEKIKETDLKDILDQLNLKESSLEEDIIGILCEQVNTKITVDNYDRPKQKIRDIIHNTDNLEYYYKLSELYEW